MSAPAAAAAAVAAAPAPAAAAKKAAEPEIPLSAEAQAKADAKKKKKAAQKAKAAAAKEADASGAKKPEDKKTEKPAAKKAEDKPAAAKAAKKASAAAAEEEDDEGEGEGDPAMEDLRNPDVVTKYRAAGDIANDAMKHVIAAVSAGKKVVELCSAGDAFITEATGKVFATQKDKSGKKVKVERGVAFPTSVSVNHIVGHFSPLAGDASVLKVGDLVKIDLGVHIDGYAAVLAHTLIVADAKDEKTKQLTGKAAQVVAAAHQAAEIAIRLLKPGNTNTQITEAIAKVAAAYKVSAVQGVLSHELKHFIIDGDKVILNRADPEQKVDDVTFETNEVYALDVVMSTGEGKPKESETRTTIYKRAPETHYSLRVKYSRQLLADIDERFPTYPFTLRALDEKTAKIGIADMVTHDLVHAYPVLTEKDGQLVAHFKITAALLPTGTVRLTNSFFDAKTVTTPPDMKLDEELTKVLAEPVRTAGAKNRKKKPAADKKGDDKKAADKKDDKKDAKATAPAAASAASPAKPAAK